VLNLTNSAMLRPNVKLERENSPVDFFSLEPAASSIGGRLKAGSR
jgi:hypothetical protein